MSDYEKHTIGSKNPIKRWLHRQRFKTSVKLLKLASNQHFLDYGCGDGELSRQIQTHYPNIKITAFDPARALYEQAVEKLKPFPNLTVIDELNGDVGSFDRIACLETVEHLPEAELNQLFSNIKCLLKKGGMCLFTFPIEHGFISLVKNTYRMLTGRDKYASIKNTLLGFFGWSVERELRRPLNNCNYIYSHIGFNCRRMIEKIKYHFVVENIQVLPFGFIFCGLGNGIAIQARLKI